MKNEKIMSKGDLLEIRFIYKNNKIAFKTVLKSNDFFKFNYEGYEVFKKELFDFFFNEKFKKVGYIEIISSQNKYCLKNQMYIKRISKNDITTINKEIKRVYMYYLELIK